MIGPLVSPKWLNDNINNPDLIILDASSPYNMAGSEAEFNNRKIIHSRYFDLKNDFSKSHSTFPNTFPSVNQFEKHCRFLGINRKSVIIVYDNIGIYTSPRAWWMFKAMGHKNVYVLNGGLPEWIKKGFQTVELYETPRIHGDFNAKLNPDNIKDIDFIRANSLSQNHILIDTRSEDRFNSKVKEPREGLRSGRIPNSINIPFNAVIKDRKYKSQNDLLRIFMNTTIDERPLTFSCGSGVTACIVLLAAQLVLENSTSIYDGSWTEYGSLIEEGI